MKQITSFTINHDYLKPGMYISRVDGDVVTYDMRMKLPNNPAGDYLEDNALHTFEHLFATYVRNTPLSDGVVYVGPMGCRTGFYLVLFGAYEPADVADLVLRLYEFARDFEGEIPGAKPEECGNYHDSDIAQAQWWAKRYVTKTLSCLDEAHTHYPALLN